LDGIFEKVLPFICTLPWHQLNGFKMFQDELGEAAEILQNPLFTDLQDHIMGAH